MIVFLVLALGLGGPALAQSKDDIKARIVAEAERNGTVPPSLALAVARVESNFNPRAISTAGARGVMQIMPATAMGEFGVAADDLWDPDLNIRLGIAYLERLYNQYGRRWELALSHYNGGSLKRGPGGFTPHRYTASYVADVKRWQAVFDQSAPARVMLASDQHPSGSGMEADIPRFTTEPYRSFIPRSASDLPEPVEPTAAPGQGWVRPAVSLACASPAPAAPRPLPPAPDRVVPTGWEKVGAPVSTVQGRFTYAPFAARPVPGRL